MVLKHTKKERFFVKLFSTHSTIQFNLQFGDYAEAYELDGTIYFRFVRRLLCGKCLMPSCHTYDECRLSLFLFL